MTSCSTLDVDDGNFEYEVIQSGQPVVVEFSDESCQPCPTLTATLRDLADQYEGRAKVAHMDIATNWQTPCSLRIKQLPAVLVFQNGHVVDRFVGEEPREVYCTAIDETLTLNWVI